MMFASHAQIHAQTGKNNHERAKGLCPNQKETLLFSSFWTRVFRQERVGEEGMEEGGRGQKFLKKSPWSEVEGPLARLVFNCDNN